MHTNRPQNFWQKCLVVDPVCQRLFYISQKKYKTISWKKVCLTLRFFYCFDFEKKTPDLRGFSVSVCTGGYRFSVTPMHKLLGASGGFLWCFGQNLVTLYLRSIAWIPWIYLPFPRKLPEVLFVTQVWKLLMVNCRKFQITSNEMNISIPYISSMIFTYKIT